MGGCPFTRCCGLRVVVGLVHCLILVFCLLVIWVKTDEAEWTLWSICVSNFSTPNPKNYDMRNDTDQQCCNLDSGDVGVPDFYHAVRALVFMLMALCCLQLFVCMDNQCLDQGKRPALMSFVSAVLGIIIVAVAFASAPEEEGEFFQGANLELSLGAFLIIPSIGISCVLVFVNFKYDQHRTREAKKKQKEKEESQAEAHLPHTDAQKKKKENKSQAEAHLPHTDAQKKEKDNKSQAKAHLPQLRGVGRNEHESEKTGTTGGGSGYKVENNEGAVSFLPKKNSVGPAPPSTLSGSVDPLSEEGPSHKAKKKNKKRRRRRGGDPHENHTYDPHNRFNSGGYTASTYSFADRYQPHNREEEEKEEEEEGVVMDRRLYSRINSGGFTTSTSFIDQTRNNEEEEVPIDSRLYSEDLRSASRASVLHNQEMREKSQGRRGGETPLLDSMPVYTYTLPPSDDWQTPSRPPPSYDAATTGDYGLDMPAPPVVAVPISLLSSAQSNRGSMNTSVGHNEHRRQ